mgnify:CR=1 FL=1
MNIMAIVMAAAVIAVVGIVVGIGLGLFGEKFKVEVDEKSWRSGRSFQATTAAAAASQAVMLWQRPLQTVRLPQMPVP